MTGMTEIITYEAVANARRQYHTDRVLHHQSQRLGQYLINTLTKGVVATEIFYEEDYHCALSMFTKRFCEGSMT